MLDFYMPTVTTHKAGDGITHVSVDGQVSRYFMVGKVCHNAWCVRFQNDVTDPGAKHGYSRGYQTYREALADCVSRIVSERKHDTSGIV